MRMKGLGTLWISGRSTNLPNGRRLWRFSRCNCRWQWDWDMENGKPMSFPSQSTSQYAPELTTATWVLSTEPFHSEHSNMGWRRTSSFNFMDMDGHICYACLSAILIFIHRYRIRHSIRLSFFFCPLAATTATMIPHRKYSTKPKKKKVTAQLNIYPRSINEVTGRKMACEIKGLACKMNNSGNNRKKKTKNSRWIFPFGLPCQNAGCKWHAFSCVEHHICTHQWENVHFTMLDHLTFSVGCVVNHTHHVVHFFFFASLFCRTKGPTDIQLSAENYTWRKPEIKGRIL